jgi:3-oxoadipate enol-lactonase
MLQSLYLHNMKIAAITCFFIILLAGCRMRIPYPSEEGFIQMGNSKIYFERGNSYGSSADPVLLLHAGFLDAKMWKAQVQDFSKHFPVVAIDIPGHGRSENDTIRYLPEDFIITILDSLKISKISLVGVSFGASCATDFAIAHPERVNKIVLAAPGISGWERKFPLDSLMNGYINTFFDALGKKDSTGAAEIFTRSWFDGPHRTPQQVNDSARRYIYETVLSNIKKHKVRGWPKFSEPPAIESLSKIKAPVLIVYGDKDMPFINSTTAYLEKNISNAKRIMIPGTGHMLNLEAPEQFNKAVIDFIGK